MHGQNHITLRLRLYFFGVKQQGTETSSFPGRFHFTQVNEIWILVTPDAQYCNNCSLKRGFHYVQVSFKTGFTVLTLQIIRSLLIEHYKRIRIFTRNSRGNVEICNRTEALHYRLRSHSKAHFSLQQRR